MPLSLPDLVTVVGSTSVVVSILGFAAATAYRSVLEKGLQSGFDHKLEEFRADLRKEEERLKADLRKQDTEISELRSGALQNAAARHLALEVRQREAVESIWKSALSFLQVGQLLELISAMSDVYSDLENLSHGDKEKVKSFIKVLDSDESKKYRQNLMNNCEIDQLYVGQDVWATYSAIKNICNVAIIQLKFMEHGRVPDFSSSITVLRNLISTALPSESVKLSSASLSECYGYFTILHSKLFVQLRQILDGREYDEKQIKTRAEILEVTKSSLI